MTGLVQGTSTQRLRLGDVDYLADLAGRVSGQGKFPFAPPRQLQHVIVAVIVKVQFPDAEGPLLGGEALERELAGDNGEDVMLDFGDAEDGGDVAVAVAVTVAALLGEGVG